MRTIEALVYGVLSHVPGAAGGRVQRRTSFDCSPMGT